MAERSSRSVPPLVDGRSICSTPSSTPTIVRGRGPHGKLVMDPAGTLYGLTSSDGGQNSGNIFKLTPSSGGYTYSSLYTFCSQPNCSDGGGPLGGLARDADGNLYGTTSGGGDTGPACGNEGCGVVFKFTP